VSKKEGPRGDEYTRAFYVSLRQRAQARELVGVPFVTTASGLLQCMGLSLRMAGDTRPQTLRFQTSLGAILVLPDGSRSLTINSHSLSQK
jgi:hypothetical protein